MKRHDGRGEIDASLSVLRSQEARMAAWVASGVIPADLADRWAARAMEERRALEGIRRRGFVSSER